MEVAGFIISIFALVIGILALVLSMRALYIIGVNAGLDKQFDPQANTVPTPNEVKIETKKEFKKPIRVEGNKIIYNEDPFIYVIEDFITDEEWMSCNISEIDLKKLEGKDCFMGLDLASTRDISALVAIFPDEDGNFDIVPYLFVPSAKVEQRKGGDGVDYQTWCDQGHLIVTEGNVQDYNFIQAKYLELAEKFNIISCAFDRWNSSQLIINLMQENLKFSPIGMGYISQSTPTKYFESLVLDKKINHGGHPVLRWMMSNVSIEEDSAGNIKLSKKKARDKIDGIAGLIMAIAEYMNTLGEDNDSIYSDRGLIFI